MKTFKISAGIALAFFAIGTILFLLQLIISEMNALTIVGFYFLITAIGINCLVALTLIGRFIIDKDHIETLKSLSIILANIPIAFVYVFIIFEYSFI